MKKSFLRTTSIALAIALGAAVAMPSIATSRQATVMPAPATAAGTVTLPAAYQPFMGQAFAESDGNTKNQGSSGDPCDPITPKNWCSCGGCSR
ncbi:hypothetical protein [Rhodanobacter sp. FW106-PBR-LB-2-11]|uniref:hypothetical protein n=1 Tax=Rhodanobacter sp. FW106-PBR-LB-2-11 TaxID=1524463 RepID=UPI0034E4E071